jgi:hypothetical protein
MDGEWTVHDIAKMIPGATIARVSYVLNFMKSRDLIRRVGGRMQNKTFVAIYVTSEPDEPTPSMSYEEMDRIFARRMGNRRYEDSSISMTGKFSLLGAYR